MTPSMHAFMVEVTGSVPPGFGTEEVLLLLGVFNCESTGAHYDPVTVSLHQSLVGDALGGPRPALTSTDDREIVRQLA